jgi:lysozyme family protein
MMDNFNVAINFILREDVEGGYSNRPNDLGGPTNRGITLNFLKRIMPNADINKLISLTVSDTKDIYKNYIWDVYKYSEINDPTIATYIFDMNVNMGPSTAHKIVQRAIWAVEIDRSIKDDGILGSVTFSKINQIGLALMPPMRAERAGYYRKRVVEAPSQIENLQGWINRTYKI